MFGAIAQLGERIVRNDEVVGSIPTSSTKFWLNIFNSFNRVEFALYKFCTTEDFRVGTASLKQEQARCFPYIPATRRIATTGRTSIGGAAAAPNGFKAYRRMVVAI